MCVCVCLCLCVCVSVSVCLQNNALLDVQTSYEVGPALSGTNLHGALLGLFETQEAADVYQTVYTEIVARGLTPVSIDECVYGPEYFKAASFVWGRLSCNAAGAHMMGLDHDDSACAVSEWSEWGDCDSKCGPGQQTRVRYTLIPDLHRRSLACGNTELIQSRQCTGSLGGAEQPQCPPTSVFTEWSDYGPCSEPCQGGTQISTRRQLAGPGTDVLDTQIAGIGGPWARYRLCNTHPCVHP